MKFSKIHSDNIRFLESINDLILLTDKEAIERCASDETEDFSFLPEIVVQPKSVEAISALLAYCHQHHIPVTPRGAGTGLSGGALPVFGGVVLDMSRLHRILHVDTDNFQVTVEPGVITQELQTHVAALGLFYPPDPASKGSCTIGGNIAENSGGPKALKYGTTKDYVLNLEMVLPTGEIINTGANVLKNATGYNLTQLVTGSEGTLGVVTKIVLRLLPSVKHDISLLVPFYKITEACTAVNSIFLAGLSPSALEFMETDAIQLAMDYSSNSPINIDPGIEALLLIELDGNNIDQLYADAAVAATVLEQYKTGEISVADSQAQKDKLWALRRVVGTAVKSQSVYREIDTVVPRASLPQLIDAVKSICLGYQLRSVCYGHAGDGNVHVNILKGDIPDHLWQEKIHACTREIFVQVANLRGTLSGEHGIGMIQSEFMDIVFSTAQLDLMRRIKDVFDPHGIMNPGKIFITPGA